MFSVCTEYTHFWQVILSIATEGGGTCLHDLYLAPSLSTVYHYFLEAGFNKQDFVLCVMWCVHNASKIYNAPIVRCDSALYVNDYNDVPPPIVRLMRWYIMR